jgi:uncharacterized metal-binding protein YceD (DUF177 family)
LSAEFVIPVLEVERGPVRKEWSLTKEWLTAAVANTEASPGDRPGRLTVSVSKTGRDFIVLGQIEAELVFPCARTLEPAPYSLRPQLTLLLRKAAAPVTPGRQSRSERHRTRAQKNEDDVELSDEDVSADTFTGDALVLDDFVREQLLLEFPMVPLRSDLRSVESAAIAPAPEIPASGADDSGVQPAPRPTDEAKLDPRLAPLLDIANELAAKLKKGSQ